VLSGLTEWVINVVERLGGIGVALLVTLENLFPPIPSEVVLPFAGVVARRTETGLVGMIAFATAGSLLGALILYGVAAAIGPERLRTFVARYGKWFRLTNADLDRAESWFDRWAVTAVLIGRCVPLIRSLVSIPAGFRRMNLAVFALYTVIGSAIWNTGLVTAGYLLAEENRWHVVERVLDYAQYAVLAGLAAAVLWYVWRRFVRPAAGA
jgi:membrane protein DedA with SNARE-associated domain